MPAVINPTLLAFALDAAAVMVRLGMAPDPWQKRLLRSRAPRVLVLSTRQAGKSTACAVLALQITLTTPRALVVLVSASRDQSEELLKKVMGHYDALGRPVPSVKENTRVLELRNGARILSLAHNPRTVKGYSKAAAVICDEAAVMDDAMFTAVSPMLAVSGGRLILVSTPFGQRGYFHQEWESGSAVWERYRITADDCPRISAAHLDAERRTKGEQEVMQEYYCHFLASTDQYFSAESIDNAFAGAGPAEDDIL